MTPSVFAEQMEIQAGSTKEMGKTTGRADQRKWSNIRSAATGHAKLPSVRDVEQAVGYASVAFGRKV